MVGGMVAGDGCFEARGGVVGVGGGGDGGGEVGEIEAESS